MRIQGKQVRFQRKVANLSKRNRNPDKVIKSLIQEKRQTESGKVEQSEFIVHSTSWRYEQKGKVMLTYVAYSDELEFRRGKTKQIPPSKLRVITKKEAGAPFTNGVGKASCRACHATYCVSDSNRCGGRLRRSADTQNEEGVRKVMGEPGRRSV